MTSRKDGLETQGRLLEAACNLFSLKGFRDVTVAEVCDAAGANLAAVNYHFGSKEQLYAAAWHHAFELESRANPPAGGVPDDAPPEERLRGRIRSLIRRFMGIGTGGLLASLLTKELANPTAIFRQAHREAVMPLRRAMQKLIRELLGPAATERDVLFTEVSVAHQCIAMGLRPEISHLRYLDQTDSHREHRDGALKKDEPPDPLARFLADVPGVDALIDHVTTFSLAGIAALRRRIEARAPQGAGQRKEPAL